MKKNFLKFGFLAIIFSMTLFATSCGGHDHDGEGHEQHEGHDADATDKTGKEYTSAYICPMNCEGSGSDELGECPVCGMKYEANENHIKDGNDH